MHTKVTHRGRRIRADYEGGPYIELTFGENGFQPTEVINVWDYEADHAEGVLAEWDDMKFGNPRNEEIRGAIRGAIRTIVRNWMLENDQEWPEWYEGYLENARF